MNRPKIGSRLAALLLVGALVAAVAAFMPGVGAAEDAGNTDNTLSVMGVGTLDARPDTARVTLGVSVLAEGAADSYAKAAALMNSVAAKVKSMGVKDEDVATSGLHLNAEYDWNDGKQILRGYRTTATVTVTTGSLDQIGALIDGAVAAGANTVQGISFFIKDQSALVNRALDVAVDDAKAKAERVASRLGTAVVGVKSVEIMTPGSSAPPIIYAKEAAIADGAAAGAMPISPGTTEYSVRVRVTFKLR